MIIKIFGSICLNLSIIAFGPKSDEQDDHIAPICAQAKKDITVSGIFGRTATILSFVLIFFF